MDGLVKKLTGEMNRDALFTLINTSEEWLMERILHYAILLNYSKYTSTLKEPWRASIEGLSASLLASLDYYDDIPEFGPEEGWKNDPCGQFARLEADLHRERGTSLSMFLGLMKYYRQSYIDLVRETDSFTGSAEWAELYINRVFDRIEIQFCQQWSDLENGTLVEELQSKNRWLVNEKNKFLTLFESYSMPCFFVDHTGKLDCLNLAAAEAFNLGLASGENYYRSQKEESVPAWLQAEIMTFSLSDDDSRVFEKEYHRGDEDRVYVVHLKRMLDISKKFSGIVVSLADITQRIKDQKTIEDAHATLLKTQEQLVQREKMASLGQMAAGVAHEINNPIGFVSSNLNSLRKYIQKTYAYIVDLRELIYDEDMIEGEQKLRKKHKLDYIQEDCEDLIDESCEGTKRVSQIVQGLKSFSRLDKEEALEDINECLETTLKIVWNQIKYNSILEKSYGDIPEIVCNAQQLNQVFVNLLVNASHAIGEKNEGKITLKTSSDAENVYISIQDNGCGIPEQNLSKIFEPFFTTKDVGQGTGLGMSIAYEIIKKHQGEITIDSQIDEGTTFNVCLPINKQECSEHK